MPQGPLTIFHLESHRSWGGQEIRVLSECLWMSKKGHRVYLAAPPGAIIYGKARAAGLPVFAFNFNNLSVVRDFIRLRGLLKRHKPQVLNTHGNMDAKVGLLAALGQRIPCVIRSRHHNHPVTPSWYNKLMYRRLSRYVFTTADSISGQIVRDLAVDPAKVITLPSGVIPPETLPDRQKAIHDLQDTLGLDRRTRFIGSVAMLRDWKGHRFVIDGFARLAGRMPDYHLVVVGDGDERPALAQQSLRQGLADRIHLVGYTDDPWPYFRAFEVNILASTKNEGTPQVLLQAMYAGCPVIGTAVGGIPDIVTHDTTGLLVPPSDATALAQAIATTLDDPVATGNRVAQAYRMVLGSHTIDQMGQRILGLYDKALADHAADGAHARRD
jgi:glycosyltransferase involved in cell wall biosynthesis